MLLVTNLFLTLFDFSVDFTLDKVFIRFLCETVKRKCYCKLLLRAMSSGRTDLSISEPTMSFIWIKEYFHEKIGFYFNNNFKKYHKFHQGVKCCLKFVSTGCYKSLLLWWTCNICEASLYQHLWSEIVFLITSSNKRTFSFEW